MHFSSLQKIKFKFSSNLTVTLFISSISLPFFSLNYFISLKLSLWDF